MSDADLRRVLDIQAITQLKSRYCRCVDLRQWDTMRTLFTPDARFEGFAATPQGADVEAFVEGVARRLDGAISVHHVHQPDIVFTGPDAARGVWAMMDYNEWPQPIGMPGAPDAPGFCGYGFYEEAYSRRPDGWKIHFMRLTRLRVDPLERPGASPIPAQRANTGWLRPSPAWLPPGG
jgi:hypothetical protein